MRRTIILALSLALALSLFPARASADPGPGETGGAAKNPNPPQLTPAERAMLAQKQAKFERTKAAALSREPTGPSSFASGIAFADIFEEPQSEPDSANWCGPGSTTAVLTNWNNIPYNYSGSEGTGAVAYMTHLARTGVGGIGPMVVTGSNGKPVTYDTTLQATINNQIGSSYYAIVGDINHVCGVCGLANFQYYLVTDIVTDVHPLFTVVWTNGLPGWGSYGAPHWQWVNSVCDTCDYLQFGDSAGPNATGYVTNPFGYWTSVPLSTYYNNYVRNPNVWDEIVW